MCKGYQQITRLCQSVDGIGWMLPCSAVVQQMIGFFGEGTLCVIITKNRTQNAEIWGSKDV